MSPSSSNSGANTRTDTWPPRWLSPTPAEDVDRGDGSRYCRFIEAVCRVTKDSYAAKAGSLIELRPWQARLVEHVFARRPDGRLRHRQALVGVARKNAKSTLSAGMALGGLVLGPAGGEVYSCAGEKEQARIVFGTARRMVEIDPELSGILKLYRDAIEFPTTGSVYRVLSAEAYSKEGLNPTLVIFDEVHVQPTRELWDTMSLATGARIDPMLLGITTAGVRTDQTGSDSLCYSLYQHGVRVCTGEVDDPAFFMAWWEPRNAEADHRDPQTWREANPAYGDLIDPEDFASAVLRTPESEFRTKRANQWVATAQAWLPAGSWEACAEPRRVIADREKVVLGFDGSRTGDATALIAVTVDERPHIELVGIWEKPAGGMNWKVPRGEVKEAIRQACKKWDVLEIAWDEFLWLDALEELEDAGLPVLSFPQTLSRMGPATQRFFESVMDWRITHDGSAALARHIANCVLKTDARGSRIVKDRPGSARKIDAAVAAVMALDRAAWHGVRGHYDPLANIG